MSLELVVLLETGRQGFGAASVVREEKEGKIRENLSEEEIQ